MTLHIGDIAPDFQSETQHGPISFHDWAGDSWVFLFSHPADFTPGCTKEACSIRDMHDEIAAAGYAKYREGFTEARVVERYLDFLKQVTG